MTMEGGRPINEAPVSVRPIQVRDGGHITQTNIADLFCSNCGSHIGWKIISVLSQDASNHQRFFLGTFWAAIGLVLIRILGFFFLALFTLNKLMRVPIHFVKAICSNSRCRIFGLVAHSARHDMLRLIVS